MTLIFSNENRILFNIESPEQLVKLAYKNRFKLLADSGVASNTKGRKKFSEHQSISYKAYRERWAQCLSPDGVGHTNLRFVKAHRTCKAKLCTTQPRFVPATKPFTVCCGAGCTPYLQSKALHDATKKPFRKILKQSFSKSKPSTELPTFGGNFDRHHHLRCKVKGKALRTLREIGGDEKLGGEHKSWLRHRTVCNLPLRAWLRRAKLCFASTVCNLPHNVRCRASICNSCSTPSPSVQDEKQNFGSSLENRWKASIKIFSPKLKLWSFTFGTSFLVVVMTSIVQKQDQNRWFFILSKNQLPGLHVEANAPSQESSWEGFENITLKYVNRNKKALFSKFPNSKDLVKSIEPYKEIWYLYFSELWKQQSLQNYTAVFSERSTPFFSETIANSEATGWKTLTPLQISDLYANSEINGKRFSFFDGKHKSWLRRAKLCTPSLQSKALHDASTVRGKWLCQPCPSPYGVGQVAHRPCKAKLCTTQPRYSLFAREPFTNRSLPPKVGGQMLQIKNLCSLPNLSPYGVRQVTHRICKAKLCTTQPRFILATKNQIKRYKNQVTFKNDSIPSKMSSPLQIENLSGQVVHRTCKAKLCMTQPSSRKGSNKNFIFSPNDIVKTLFYKFGNFSIESKSFLGGKATGPTVQSKTLRPLREIGGEQKSSQEVDLFDDFSLSSNKNAFDRDRLSFLQQENFFKTPNCFKPEVFKTSFIYPFYVVKRDSLQSLVTEPVSPTNPSLTSPKGGLGEVAKQVSSKGQQIGDFCSPPRPSPYGVEQVAHRTCKAKLCTTQPRFVNQVDLDINYFKNKSFEANLQNEKKSYHSSPQKVSKSFKVLSFKTKRLRLYTASKKATRFTTTLQLEKLVTNSNLPLVTHATPPSQIEARSGKLLCNQDLCVESFVDNQNLLFSEPTLFQTDNGKSSQFPEKMANCLLSKQKRISNRFMSGYKFPEIKSFQIESKPSIFSVVREAVLSPKFVFSIKPFILRRGAGCTSYGNVTKGWFRENSSDLAPTSYSIKIPPSLPFYRSKSKLKKANLLNTTDLRLDHIPYNCKAKLLNGGRNFCSANTGTLRTQIGSLKKIPYRKLSLNLLEEIIPLFDEVNKTFRISPYQFRFKKGLFTDYNDYLSWQKDTSAAISIAPSLEEDNPTKDSWLQSQMPLRAWSFPHDPHKMSSLHSGNEDLKKEKNGDFLKGDNETKQPLILSKPSTESNGAGDFSTKQENSDGKGLQKEKQKEDSIWSSLDKNPAKLENSQERFSDPSSIGEEDDKKKGVTKFEWLEQIREGDRLVEKRKDFQKEAYRNRQALYLDHLRTKPGKVQRLFVTGRKESFFGITNLFPKRLVAQDQKQIKHQILRENEDQKVVSLLLGGEYKSPICNTSSFKTDNFDTFLGGKATCPTPYGEGPCLGLDSSNNILVENLLKSGVLPSTEGDGPQNKVLHGTQKGKDGNQSSTLNLLGRQELFSRLRTVPRNQVFHKSQPSTNSPDSPEEVQHFKKIRNVFSGRQHPIYTPNRRLRLRMPQSSLSLQNNNPQSRLDDLNLSQSHRWWQKRRLESSLLGTPSKRYLVMPEIRPQDWKKIIEWQLKIFFLEEEKRIEPLFLEKTMAEGGGGTPYLQSFVTNLQPKDLFKIKKIAIYLPWTTLKKSLKKPFEWPITGLSYHSSLQDDSIQNDLGSKLLCNQDLYDANQSFRSVKNTVLNRREQSFRQNKKVCSCFIASIAPNFKSVSAKESFARHKFCYQAGQKKIKFPQKQLHQTSVYKPFLFEETPKDLYLLLHSLALAVVFKQFLVGLSKGFGKLITQKIKNSSLGLALLPIFFNARSRKNQIPEFSHLKKRLNNLLSSEETISSLSELVWYLRNSCRGRMIPRGVVLLETFSSETTAFLKAIGGEAQVPVIVQSLRGLPFTQSHPQRHFEKILQFAQKRSPCILFLDDLDSIGQSRTLLLKNNVESSNFWDKKENHLEKDNEIVLENKLYNFTGGNKETFEKRKWKKPNTGVWCSPLRHLQSAKRGTKLLQSEALHLSVADSQNGTTPLFSSGIWKTSTRGGYKTTRSLGQNSHNLLFANRLLKSSSDTRLSSSVTSKSKLFNSSSPLSKNGFFPLKLPFSKDNKTLHLSETEKIVEQRRIDLMLRLLTVMDGISHLKGVLIVTTSKNPALLDPALLRPGRFEKLINLKLPNKKKRIELLKLEIQKIGYTNPMPWEYFGTETQNMTGTQISSAINHSAFRAILQSTVHTFSTLEYGISCAKGDSLSIGHPKKQKTIDTSTPFLSEEFSRCSRSKAKRDRHIRCSKAQFCVPFKESIKSEDLYGQVAHRICCARTRNTGRCAKLCTTQPKKVDSLSSEIAFYQAGKGVVQGLISHDAILSFCSSLRRDVSYPQNFGSQYKSSSTCKAKPKKALSRIFSTRSLGGVTVCPTPYGEGQIKTDCFSFIKLHFVQSIVQLYAGKASLSLYLDSISNLKNKGLEKSVQQPLFLESNLSSKEGLHASLIIESYLTFFNSSKKGGVKPLCSVSSPLVFPKKNENKFVPVTKICKLLSKKNFSYLNFRNISKKSYRFDSKAFLQHNRRKYFDFALANEPNDFVFVYDKIDNDLWWGEKISETIKTVKRPLGNWYRLYLPKLEEDKNNREWLLPDQFFDQRISISWLQSHLSDRFSKGIGGEQSYLFKKPISYYSIVLTCFYSAFQNCAENRELLDFLSDHLIRFKTLRLHEIMRIVSFYL